ncbi:MAG: TatD family hydrolase [Bacteroidetes bacterium]|nr:TatD family hydrolase [Bacteroidota bacterium]
MIDTHTHIYLNHFTDDRSEMLQRAEEAGVQQMFLPNIDKESVASLKALADAHEHIYPMMGLHPSHVKTDYEEELAVVWQELDSNYQYYAVGEIGIDLYWDKTFIKEQQDAFDRQIKKAKAMGLPIVIHCRDAFDETFEVLESNRGEGLSGIFHCFTGNLQQAHQALSLNLKLGIGGVVTFKNGGLDKVVVDLDLKDLVLETDAPYLAPKPFRGKRNEPSYVKYVAQKIADLHQVSIEEVDTITSATARKIFGI